MRFRAILVRQFWIGAGALAALCAVLSVPSAQAQRPPVQTRFTDIGNLGLTFTNQGWFGSLLAARPWPSAEYPLNSKVEHLYAGALWVGGIDAEGIPRVSAGADDTGLGAGAPKIEYAPSDGDVFRQISRNPLSPNFSVSALADQHYIMSYTDQDAGGGGGNEQDDPHVPIGVRVKTDVLAYAPSFADDFVILLFEVENVSTSIIRDVYLAWYNELIVMNKDVTNPEEGSGFFYDDKSGYIGPEAPALAVLDPLLDPTVVEEDPTLRIMYCYDDDGEDGRAASWVGVRVLGHDAPEGHEFSYRQWTFSQSYLDSDLRKYGIMRGCDIGLADPALETSILQDGCRSSILDVGAGSGQGSVDFTRPANWSSLFSVGPWPPMFPGDKVSIALAFVCGPDGDSMLRNSRIAQFTFDNGFELPAGPPSPRLEVIPGNNQVTLLWDGGQPTPEGEAYDPVTASPEYHRSVLTNEFDFQGYRIYRIFGDRTTEDPFQQASLVAQFDITQRPDGSVDPDGFNVGLPSLDEQGRRVFVDPGVLNGFPYRYAVTSYAARDPRTDLPELESGFNENSAVVTPGSPAAGDIESATGQRPKVGAYPNPYRAASVFDRRFNTGAPRELGRQLFFTNVPARARIEVFNVSGTRVDEFFHDDPTTGQVEWRLLSQETRAIAPGLYVYAVEDLDTGEVQQGKLVILK